MITTTWLNSILIQEKDTTVSIDIYGVSSEKIFIIESKSGWHVTTVIEAWSV